MIYESKTYLCIFGFVVAQVFCVVSLCNCMDKLSSRLDNGFKEIKIESSEMSDRYELKQLGSMARDQFLLDKQTGYVWQLAKDTKTGDLFFYKLDRY